MPLNCGNPEHCRPCFEPTRGSSVQQISQDLRSWLTQITCIPWYHGHQNKPESEEQFGVVEFIASQASGIGKKNLLESSDIKQCYVWDKSWQHTLRLSVKGFKKLQNGDQQVSIYPMDVLADVYDKYNGFPTLSNLLSQLGISINNFFDITTLVKEDDGCCWDNQAHINIEICVTRKVSMTEDQIGQICVKFCEGQVICPEPQEDC